MAMMTVIEQIRKRQRGIIKDNNTYANNTRMYANDTFTKIILVYSQNGV